MRKILFFIFFLSLLNKGYSQNNFNPFKLDNIEWFESGYPGGQPPPNKNFNFYKICGDTLYNDTLYKKLYVGTATTSINPAPSQIPTAPTFFTFNCFFRQDTLTKSNYYRYSTWNKDSLLFSYNNLQVGDTVKRGSYSAVHIVIVATDSILIYGKKFKIYYTATNSGPSNVNYCKGQYSGMFLIEGLGHCYGLIDPYVVQFEWSNNVDSISFTANCTLTNGISQYSNLSSQISIYPNPGSGIFTLETNTAAKQAIQVYDVNGRVVLTQVITGKTSLDMSNLPAGVYNINLTDNEGIVNKRMVIVK